MKLTKLRGIAHDLAHHISFELGVGSSWMSKYFFEECGRNIGRDVLKENNKFDKYCVKFFKQRLSKWFDFGKIDTLNVSVIGTEGKLSLNFSIMIQVKVKKYSFSYECKSKWVY